MRITGSDSRGRLYAFLAACSWSTAGVLQQQLHCDIATQLAYRSLFAFISLAILVLARGESRRDLRNSLRPAALVVTALTAVTSGCFIAALNETAAADVLFLFASGPIFVALLAARFLDQRLTWSTLIAAALALAGVVVMIGSPTGGAVLGDALSLVAVVTFAVVIVVCGKHSEISMLPAVCLAQLLVLAVTLPFAHPTQPDLSQLGWLVLFGAGQLSLGEAFFVAAARRATAAEVATISLLEIVLGPVWVWLNGTQSPTVATVLGGVLVLLGVVVQMRAKVRRT